MAKPEVQPYGTWASPIAKDLLAYSSNQLVDVFVGSNDSEFYYLENRSANGPRQVIVRSVDEKTEDILSTKYSAESKIHEYGGAAVAQTKDNRFIFVDGETQAVCYLNKQGDVHEIYRASGSRFADFDQIMVNGKNWIIAIHEKPSEHYNELVLLDPDSGSIATTISGADFYTAPKFSPDGKWLSWKQWDLVDMPWTGAQLHVARFEGGQISNKKKIAGEATKESISQPTWSLDGSLFFVSDRTGFYKLYRVDPNDPGVKTVGTGGLHDYEHVEFSAPDWRLGARTYVHLTSTLIVAAYLYQAGSGLAVLDLNINRWSPLSSAYIEITNINRVSDTRFVLIGSTASSPSEIVELDIHDTSYRKVIARSSSLTLSQDIFSTGQSIVFPRSDGTNSYAWLWPPHNPAFKAPEGTRAPLIVQCHGGPTIHTGPGLDLQKQYWTTRGYAYASVNYGGSSGYGRAYRDALHGTWGELDASDVAAFARYMCSQDCPEEIRTDPDQVGITGGSAGGYTVLRALTVNAFPWKAGVSLYGIGNISLLEQDTHKFESRYTRILFDPPGKTLSDKERAALYHDKSPQFFATNITAATLLLQGSKDKVVPPNQAEEMKKEIEKAGHIAKLVIYDGEGHGFRKAASIMDMLEQMEIWWKRYLVDGEK